MSHLTVEKYNNEYRGTILPFVTAVTTKDLIISDVYLTTCFHRADLNKKFSINQYCYLGKDGYKLKFFHHAYG